MSNPFSVSSSRSGHGCIRLTLLPPCTSVLDIVSYQYPLKLIAPSPITVINHEGAELLVHTIFVLTYGGGIVAGDILDLHVSLAESTRLILLTQGSTKIFKTPSRDLISGQRMSVDIRESSALCYLPEPVQPFADSAFEQTQTYNILGQNGNMCVCDWVCEGRKARGERWRFHRYVSRNEVWWISPGRKKTLLLRDNVIVDSIEKHANTILERVGGLGVFGTLIIRGPLFDALGTYFLEEFSSLPRIGGRNWDGSPQQELSSEELRRQERQLQETTDGVLWTAANVRGFVLVKFGANEVEGVKRWLTTIFKTEGSIERLFGERALLCLK